MMISLTKIIGFLEEFHLLIKTECITNASIKADNPALHHWDQYDKQAATGFTFCTSTTQSTQRVRAFKKDTAAWR